MNIKPGKQFDIKEFKSPSTEYNLNFGWVWNAPVTKEGIDERLEEFCRAGIKCLYILPLPKDFRSERLRTFLSPEYLTKEFFDLIDYATHRASDMGIEMWIYDEGGWPSGGACYNTVRENRAAMMKTLDKRRITLHCDNRYVPGENAIALFDNKRRLPDNYIANRTVELTEYYVKHWVENGNRVDNTSASATDTFINNTYEKYKDAVGDLFGEKLPLIFTDEPGILRNSIAEDEFRIFKEEYGYDLKDYVYVIEGAGELAVTDEEIKARIDHLTLLGKLFRENTCKKLFSWCEENGVYYSGHLDLDNRPWGAMAKGYFSHIDLLRNFHVPGIDVIWEQIRYPHEDGSVLDDETQGMGFFPRFASSAARQEGRNLALTETFSIYGDGVTPDQFRYAFNFQVMRGINVFNTLNLPYGKSRLGALMMRPAFCPEKPGFYNMRELCDYYARVAYLTRIGYAEGDTALYHPCRDYCADVASCDEATAAFKASGTALEDKNIPFDIVDDYVIRDSIDTGVGLRIGDAVYKHIVVTPNKYMPEDVRAKVAPYLGEGEPMLRFESKNLRLMTRKLDTGRLYFIFNELSGRVTEKVSLDKSRTVRLDLLTGEIYAFTGEITLECGELAVLLESDTAIATVSECSKCVAEICDLTPVSYKKFNIGYNGIYATLHEGAPVIDDSFSGEVSYEGSYGFANAPKAGERYLVELIDCAVSASLEIGEAKLVFGTTPMRAIVDGAKLEKCGKLTLTLANTAANEIIAKKDIIASFPAAEVGSYTEKMNVFEARKPEIKLGKIRISLFD